MQVTTIGVDLAKHVFQVHGINAEGEVVLWPKLRRAEVVGFFGEAPAYSDRNGGVRHVAPLGATTWRARPLGTSYPTYVREASEERR
jgi:hypothetical protein